MAAIHPYEGERPGASAVPDYGNITETGIREVMAGLLMSTPRTLPEFYDGITKIFPVEYYAKGTGTDLDLVEYYRRPGEVVEGTLLTMPPAQTEFMRRHKVVHHTRVAGLDLRVPHDNMSAGERAALLKEISVQRRLLAQNFERVLCHDTVGALVNVTGITQRVTNELAVRDGEVDNSEILANVYRMYCKGFGCTTKSGGLTGFLSHLHKMDMPPRFDTILMSSCASLMRDHGRLRESRKLINIVEDGKMHTEFGNFDVVTWSKGDLGAPYRGINHPAERSHVMEGVYHLCHEEYAAAITIPQPHDMQSVAKVDMLYAMKQSGVFTASGDLSPFGRRLLDPESVIDGDMTIKEYRRAARGGRAAKRSAAAPASYRAPKAPARSAAGRGKPTLPPLASPGGAPLPRKSRDLLAEFGITDMAKEVTDATTVSGRVEITGIEITAKDPNEPAKGYDISLSQAALDALEAAFDHAGLKEEASVHRVPAPVKTRPATYSIPSVGVGPAATVPLSGMDAFLMFMKCGTGAAFGLKVKGSEKAAFRGPPEQGLKAMRDLINRFEVGTHQMATAPAVTALADATVGVALESQPLTYDVLQQYVETTGCMPISIAVVRPNICFRTHATIYATKGRGFKHILTDAKYATTEETNDNRQGWKVELTNMGVITDQESIYIGADHTVASLVGGMETNVVAFMHYHPETNPGLVPVLVKPGETPSCVSACGTFDFPALRFLMNRTDSYTQALDAVYKDMWEARRGVDPGTEVPDDPSQPYYPYPIDGEYDEFLPWLFTDRGEDGGEYNQERDPAHRGYNIRAHAGETRQMNVQGMAMQKTTDCTKGPLEGIYGFDQNDAMNGMPNSLRGY